MFERHALKIALIYIALSAVWIVFSDQTVDTLFANTKWLTPAQTLKGWLFVLLTGGLLYGLMRRTLRQIETVAFKDTMLGLPNRLGFLTELDKRCRRYATRSPFALAILDLDHFADLNDVQGHDRGDELLTRLGTQLRKELGEHWYIARIGGDEFGLLSPPGLDRELVEAALERLQRQLIRSADRPRALGQTLSIGTSWYPDQGTNSKDLMRHADMALTTAKHQGRNRLYVYHDELKKDLIARLSLLRDLKSACRSGAFHLAYQPQWSAQGECWSSVEVLVRWRHPDGGFVSPDVFIPLAEREGLIRPITDFVVKTALRELASAGIDRQTLPRLAFNLSHPVLLDSEAMDQLFDDITEAGTELPRIMWEITETATMENLDPTLHAMQNWRSEGVAFSIDDFGTGYSSLSRLKQMPLSELKIDRSFIDGLPADTNGAVIVEAILAMARTLSLDVVAEGVETREQADWLTRKGCQTLQGYYFARPMPIADLARTLNPS